MPLETVQGHYARLFEREEELMTGAAIWCSPASADDPGTRWKPYRAMGFLAIPPMSPAPSVPGITAVSAPCDRHGARAALHQADARDPRGALASAADPGQRACATSIVSSRPCRRGCNCSRCSWRGRNFSDLLAWVVGSAAAAWPAIWRASRTLDAIWMRGFPAPVALARRAGSFAGRPAGG